MMRWFLVAAVAFTSACFGQDVYEPVVDGQWWQVAGDPDLGEFTTDKQQPVDFGLWQAADGTWQLWSCIRHTDCGGNTRLFHCWEGAKLTDTDWKPMGIAQTARTDLGETLGGQQAPHVVRRGGLYYMAYGDWVNICFSTSVDGKKFERVVQPNGTTGVFSEGPGLNTRDPMLIEIGGLWYCYYTAHNAEHGYDYCRTTPRLDSYKWSNSCIVAYGGQVGDYRWSAECPHVVELSQGNYYLFRTQRYGANAKTSVYHSTNPLNFGIDDDKGFVCSLPVAAPEIILHEGQYYIASLMGSLKGIHIAKLKWVPRSGKPGRAVFDFEDAKVRAGFKAVEGNLAGVFTTSRRSSLDQPGKWAVATAEIDGAKFDDDLKGIIESPAFTVDADAYVLLISGGSNMENCYIALIEADGGRELVRFTGHGENAFRRQYVDSTKWKGARVKLRIVDNAAGGWGHINCAGLFTRD